MTDVRLVTFNIQHGRRPDGVVDVPCVGEVVRGFGADVVGLQEVDQGMSRSDRVDTVAVVAEATGLVAHFGESRRLQGGSFGNAVLAGGAIGDVTVVALPGRPDGTRAPRRTVLLARVALAGGELSVGVCHLGLVRAEAEGQLRAAFEALRGRPGPWALLGDWNLSRRHVRPIVAAAGFALAGARATFPARLPYRRIDHVAVDGMEVVATAAPPVPVGDHRPLVVDVRMPPA